RRPIAGPLAFRLLVEGTLAKPVIFAGFDASRLAYGSFAFSRARGRVAIEGPRIDILGAQFAYGPIQLDARGSLVAKNHLDATIVGSAQGDSDALPYAARIVPHMQLNATAVVAGVDRNLQVDGVVNGVSPNRTLAGIASVAPDGTGSAGPIAIEGPNGESAYVRVALDRPNNVAEVIFNANRFAVPSGALAALPEAGGIVSGRGIAVARDSRLAYLSGDAAIEAMHYRGVTLDRALVRGGYAGGQGVATVIADGRMAGAPLAGSTVLTYAGDRLRIADATAMIAGAVGFADGTVSGLRSGAPHYDLAAQLRAGDLAALARTLGLSLPYPEGTVDADVRVRGAGSQANVAGDVRIPEGSINGLAFAGATRFAGDPSQLRGNGNVRVGSSALRFDAGVGPGHLSLNARGNDVNLSDFNDYFDAADTLHGRGHLAVALTRTPDSLVSSGDVAFADLRYKRFPLGNATARWTTNGSTIAGSGFVNGRGGQVRLAGTGSQSSMNVRASARNLDLGVWLPAAGYTAPVVGLVDANVNAQGTLRAPILDATAALRKGIVAGIPIDRFTVAATARGGRARVASAELAIPNLTANASGSFGLTPRSPLDLTARAETPDIGALSKTLGKPYPVGGTLATTLHVTGTPLAPRLEDTLDLAQFRYKNFIVPRAHTELALAGGTLDVRNGVVDLQRGSASFAGTFPLAISGLAFRETAAPVRGRLDARGIELAQFIPLLPDPKKTKLAGTIDGAVGVGGSLEAPLFDGALTLSRGYYSSPQESKPIANATAALQFAGTSATLGALHADVGGGTLDGSGNVRIAGLRDPLHSVAFDVAATAHRAVLDFPAYFKGELDGTLNARQAVGGTPTIAADLALSHARIPFSTILNQTKSHPAGPAPPNVAFDSHFSVGPDVRVQGTGVDVGIAGALAFGGTLAAPSLNGEIASTGGTVDFYRDFTIQRGAATFSGGVVPDLTAVATTYLVDPGAEVRLRITGPATGLNLALSSNPPLDRSQILGLLIGGPNLAGIEGLQTAQGPAQPTLFQGMTNGYINTLFTRNLLEPLSSSLGTALGLQNLQLNYDLAGNEGFSANVRRSLGKNMSLLFATSYGFPSRTTLGVSDRLSNNSSVRATIFNTYGQAGLGYYAPYLVAQPGTNISLQASQPAAGESGFSIQYVRHFK
ncbi:MAG: translocation/assembly module TamB domain-containing protein, partial [Candidatus Eremiobacteraeota bacterium]|nr:translocation/assembly module TamB domain-containing protein [Candidatus Eremiobacteraeota bacterium]